MSSVTDAGLCVRTNQIDFDEEVAFAAERAIYDHVRSKDTRPFLMVASLTHPHDPFAITREYWDLYAHDAIDLPRIGIMDVPLDPHSARLRHVCAMDEVTITEAQVRNARHAYYGAVSFCDAQLGRLLKALEATGLDDTIVLFLGDHGEMLGERGLWYKMTFFEGGARVPLVVSVPGRTAPLRHRRRGVADRHPADPGRSRRRRSVRAGEPDRWPQPRSAPRGARRTRRGDR